MDLRVILALVLTILLSAGCASSTAVSQSPQPLAGPVFPPDALVTQRGILTLRGRQFSLNGYLNLSASRGQRLVLTDNFGGVLAAVLIPLDGSIHVLRSSRLFKPSWIRDYVATDLASVTGNAPQPEVRSPSHFLIRRDRYTLDLQTVAVRSGPQDAGLFDKTAAGKNP